MPVRHSGRHSEEWPVTYGTDKNARDGAGAICSGQLNSEPDKGYRYAYMYCHDKVKRIRGMISNISHYRGPRRFKGLPSYLEQSK